MTTIILMITIMCTAKLFLQFCGLSANFSMLWLTVMNYRLHERNTTPTPHQYCMLSTGMMVYMVCFFSLQTPIKDYPYSLIELYWCLAVWSESTNCCRCWVNVGSIFVYLVIYSLATVHKVDYNEVIMKPSQHYRKMLTLNTGSHTLDS